MFADTEGTILGFRRDDEINQGPAIRAPSTKDTLDI
jgi:hypothetical protein